LQSQRPTVQPPEKVRVDKWLWAVRLFKTRALAAEACRGGHVKIGSDAVKPSREVKAGDIVAARVGELNRVVKVIGAIEKRVGPKLVNDYVEDLTPAEEYLRVMSAKEGPGLLKRPKGAGRPTKKERRDLEKIGGEDL
jgi:ribosome-associated heat shock protein Hsp15